MAPDPSEAMFAASPTPWNPGAVASGLGRLEKELADRYALGAGAAAMPSDTITVMWLLRLRIL